MNRKTFKTIKIALYLIMTILFSSLIVVFSLLYINTITIGFVKEYSTFIKIITVAITSILSAVCFVFVFKNQEAVFKVCIFFLFCFSILLLLLYILKITNFWDKVNNIEELRIYISSFGTNAILIFVFMQILQVVILPIPGIIAIGAGVALFGVKLGAIYSLIGIIIGSFLAYYIGKYPGERVVGWLVGRSNLKKALKKIEGKDKIILTIMFIFPFFPDDLLCFIAGMSSMSQIYFTIMIILTRTFGVYTTAYSVNGSLIPYNTPWGIALWSIIFLASFVFVYLINKYGKRLEERILKKFKK